MDDSRGVWLRGELDRRRPVDDREAASLLRVRAELDHLPHPFDRAAAPVHVTASAVVVGPQGVLLHRHKRLGMWLQPGGHLDPGEWPAEAAVREMYEETGLVPASAPAPAAPVAHVDVHGGGLGHVHLDVRYVLEVVGDAAPAPALGESPEVRWFRWHEAMAVADEGLRGLLRALTPGGALGSPA